MSGYELRYQNGFDCQGLWVEIEVEKSRIQIEKDVEEFGIEKFVNLCKESIKVFEFKLSNLFDWDIGWTGKFYYTMSNENNYTI